MGTCCLAPWQPLRYLSIRFRWQAVLQCRHLSHVCTSGNGYTQLFDHVSAELGRHHHPSSCRPGYESGAVSDETVYGPGAKALLESARIDGPVSSSILSIVMPIRAAWLTLIILSFQQLWGQTGGQFIYSEHLNHCPMLAANCGRGLSGRRGCSSQFGRDDSAHIHIH